MIVTGSKQSMQNAVNKAIRLGGAKRVRYLGGRNYVVSGQTGVYSVDINGHNWRCNCEAGGREIVCWHLAATWLRRMGQESLVRGAGVSA